MQAFLITLCMAVGSYLGGLFTDVTGFALPDYVSAKFVVVIAGMLLINSIRKLSG